MEIIQIKLIYFVIFAVAVSSLIISGCVSSPPPETIPVPTAPIQTLAPTVTLTPVEADSDEMNSTDFSKKYYNEVIGNIHAFGLFNSSSTDSIYIKSDSERITLYVPVMLDEKGETPKMYENPIITGNLTTSIINTEHGKALKINGSGGEIKIIQDIGNLGSIENDYRFVEELTISMSNSTPPGKNWVFDADAWVYSETEVRDFRLFFSRSGAYSGKILFLRTGSPWTSREKDSQRLIKGWQLVKLFGNGLWVD
ncbi:Uncharacterised protein [uncultured archaeon]|nr:Uncharacterised protein [uncultured archaeon]